MQERISLLNLLPRFTTVELGEPVCDLRRLIDAGFDELLRRRDIAESQLIFINDCETGRVPINRAAPVAAVAFELIANSIDHGHPDLTSGAVISLSVKETHHGQDGRLRCQIITEDNGRGCRDPSEKNFGSGLRFIQRLLKERSGVLELSDIGGLRVEATLSFDETL